MIHLRDVTARDGLQGERPVQPAQRAELVRRLIAAGLGDVEVAAFVSPKAVPAMAGAADVVVAARAAVAESGRDVTLWALVPNAKGAELAAAAGVDHLTITVSASPTLQRQEHGHVARRGPRPGRPRSAPRHRRLCSTR